MVFDVYFRLVQPSIYSLAHNDLNLKRIHIFRVFLCALFWVRDEDSSSKICTRSYTTQRRRDGIIIIILCIRILDPL